MHNENIECSGIIICSNDPGYAPLTPNKKYEYTGIVVHSNTGTECYIVVDDNGNEGWYDKKIFTTLKEYREVKLTQLMNG